MDWGFVALVVVLLAGFLGAGVYAVKLQLRDVEEFFDKIDRLLRELEKKLEEGGGGVRVQG